jgi:hypothetical protein
MMSMRPAFTEVSRDADSVVLGGRSDPDPPDFVDIRVVLSQGRQVSSPAIVETPGGSWTVDVPAAGFEAGPATAFGIETRLENATTITWAQTVQIP